MMRKLWKSIALAAASARPALPAQSCGQRAAQQTGRRTQEPKAKPEIAPPQPVRRTRRARNSGELFQLPVRGLVPGNVASQ